MKEKESGKYKNYSTDKLKEEYIVCAFGEMIFGVKTARKRKELSDEIERRERQKEIRDAKEFQEVKKEQESKKRGR